MGEEGYWYQTSLGVRAEPLGTSFPSYLHPPLASGYVSGTRLEWVLAFSSLTDLNSGQKSPQRVLSTPPSLTG